MTEYSWNMIPDLPAQMIGLQTNCVQSISEPAKSVASKTSTATAYGDFNLALHVGDDPQQVLNNRERLLTQLQTYPVTAIHWINQVHGTDILHIDANYSLPKAVPVADAIISTCKGFAIAVLTADCLPVLLYDQDAKNIAVVHAGWRGLVNGIIQKTAQAMPFKPTSAFLGAAIGPSAFEVGAEVRAQFITMDAASEPYFVPTRLDLVTQVASPSKPSQKYDADLYGLARLALHSVGIQHISGGKECTVQTKLDGTSYKYYSYRRQPVTGRQALVASLI